MAELHWRRHQSGVIEIVEGTRVMSRVLNPTKVRRFLDHVQGGDFDAVGLQSYLDGVRKFGVPPECLAPTSKPTRRKRRQVAGEME